MEKWKEEKSLNQIEADRALWRIKALIAENMTYKQICQVLNDEGIRTIKERAWTPQNLKILVYRLRHKASSFYAISQKRCGFEVEALA